MDLSFYDPTDWAGRIWNCKETEGCLLTAWPGDSLVRAFIVRGLLWATTWPLLRRSLVESDDPFLPAVTLLINVAYSSWAPGSVLCTRTVPGEWVCPGSLSQWAQDLGLAASSWLSSRSCMWASLGLVLVSLLLGWDTWPRATGGGVGVVNFNKIYRL